VPPSPKFQLQVLIVPVEELVNVTFSGALPELGLALKLATGGGVTVTDVDAVAVPPGPVAVRVYVVVVVGVTFTLPVVDRLLPALGLMDTVVAFVVLHASTEDSPAAMLAGVAVKLDTVGSDGVATVTVTVRVAVPLIPVAVKV
jgi:hypothetical protein